MMERVVQKNRKLSRTSESGFTLLELLVVLIILGLVISIAAPQLFDQMGGAKRETASIQIERLSSVLDIYRLNIGHYPTQDEGLDALLRAPSGVEKRWRGPYIKKESMLKDPWGNSYLYVIPGKHNNPYDLYSLAADGQEGGEGDNQDITNW